jgi:hypothetical protein
VLFSVIASPAARSMPEVALQSSMHTSDWPGSDEGHAVHAERVEAGVAFHLTRTADVSQRLPRLIGSSAECSCDPLIIAAGAAATCLDVPLPVQCRAQGLPGWLRHPDGREDHAERAVLTLPPARALKNHLSISPVRGMPARCPDHLALSSRCRA